jgi:pimeloyl-ACP methyl ester carboxylesterase
VDHLIDEGMGRSILVVRGGMGDLTSWVKVTDRLRDRYRVVRLHRRQYRLDVPRKITIAEEAEEVLAAAATLDGPVLVGHSSGAVVALEALAAAEPGQFAGAVLYEPPLIVDRPLGGEANDRARAAVAAGKPGTAFEIFLRDVVGVRGLLPTAARVAINRRRGEMGARVERQLDDNDAINAVGNRLAAYSKIEIPVLLVGGDRSPRHLRERLDALQAALPNAQRVTMHGQGHNADRSAPDRLAEIVSRFVDETNRGPAS